MKKILYITSLILSVLFISLSFVSAADTTPPAPPTGVRIDGISPAGTSLAISAATANRGQSVTLPLTLNNSGAPAISTIMFDVTYDSSKMTYQSATAGAAATAASKSVSVSNPTANSIRLILIDLINKDQKAIANGQTTLVTFTVSGRAPVGATALNITNLSASDKDGGIVTVTGQNSSVIIQ